jgi:hypothetical protein
MIFSGQRKTNGAVGTETSTATNASPLPQLLASNMTTGGSASATPVVKPSVVLIGKLTPQLAKSASPLTSSVLVKSQSNQPNGIGASRPAGSWW